IARPAIIVSLVIACAQDTFGLGATFRNKRLSGSHPTQDRPPSRPGARSEPVRPAFAPTLAKMIVIGKSREPIISKYGKVSLVFRGLTSCDPRCLTCVRAQARPN